MVPGPDGDTELEGAVLGHEFIEPIRWQKPSVLLLERHEYYEKMKPIENSKFESIGTLARWYWITATISPEGKVTLVEAEELERRVRARLNRAPPTLD